MNKHKRDLIIAKHEDDQLNEFLDLRDKQSQEDCDEETSAKRAPRKL